MAGITPAACLFFCYKNIIQISIHVGRIAPAYDFALRRLLIFNKTSKNFNPQHGCPYRPHQLLDVVMIIPHSRAVVNRFFDFFDKNLIFYSPSADDSFFLRWQSYRCFRMLRLFVLQSSFFLRCDHISCTFLFSSNKAARIYPASDSFLISINAEASFVYSTAIALSTSPLYLSSAIFLIAFLTFSSSAK